MKKIDCPLLEKDKFIVILDKHKSVHDCFSFRFAGRKLIHTYTVDECHRILSQGNVEYLYIAHQLGTDQTGYDLLDLLLKGQWSNIPRNVIVHDTSDEIVHLMKRLLPKIIHSQDIWKMPKPLDSQEIIDVME